MTNEFDYYLIGTNNDGDVPLMVNDDEFDSFGIGVLLQYRMVNPDFIGRIAFNPLIKMRKPRLADGMSLRGDCRVFSYKIYDVLNKTYYKRLAISSRNYSRK